MMVSERGELPEKLNKDANRTKTTESVYIQVRQLLENGQGLPSSWGQPTEKQKQALEESGGNIPAQLDLGKMDGGIPVRKER